MAKLCFASLHPGSSVSDEVKTLFNATFAHKNKSAIIAELMLEAVERDRGEARAVPADELRRWMAGMAGESTSVSVCGHLLTALAAGTVVHAAVISP